MAKITVELVKYDMDKTKKRKRSNFIVDSKSEEAIITKLERIHKGEKVQKIHEVIWGEEKPEKKAGTIFTGIVNFFDEDKGFGFIEADADIDDLFFHESALNGKRIGRDDLVQFEIGQGLKGELAIHVKLINKRKSTTKK